MSSTVIPLCRHTKANGRRCHAPALVTSAFCRFHQKTFRARRAPGPGPGLSTNVLYPLRNAHSVQQALSIVFSGLATGQLHHRQSGKMLYALQLIMSSNK